MNISSKRGEDESFYDYKKRLSLNNKLLKWYKKGQVLYSPIQEVNLPELNERNQVKYDQKGDIIYSDKKVIIGPYRTSLFGSLKDFSNRAKELIKGKQEKTKLEENKLEENKD